MNEQEISIPILFLLVLLSLIWTFVPIKRVQKKPIFIKEENSIITKKTCKYEDY